jgi:FKBP-type peptidyl-prolyl cis-trans isomerase FkpA
MTHPSHPSHPSHLSHLSYLSHLLLLLVFVSACGGNGAPANSAAPAGAPAPLAAPATAPAPPAAYSQTQLAPGSGTQAAKGAQVTMKYTGWVYDASKPENKGTKFDSTDDHEPITFTLGRGDVIPGWDRGIEGMRVGEKRRLIISPDLGYGAEGTPGGPIPPNAGLVFDVELADVK